VLLIPAVVAAWAAWAIAWERAVLVALAVAVDRVLSAVLSAATCETEDVVTLRRPWACLGTCTRFEKKLKK
jgi:hypothetical protein